MRIRKYEVIFLTRSIKTSSHHETLHKQITDNNELPSSWIVDYLSVLQLDQLVMKYMKCVQ